MIENITYTLKNDGVYKIVKAEDNKGNPVINTFKICSYLEILALTRDSNNKNWGRLIKLKDRDGTCHTFPISMDWLAISDFNSIMRFFLNHGLELKTICRDTKEDLMQYITNTDVQKRILSVPKTGWYQNTFILPNQIIGESEEKIIFQNNTELEDNYNTKGTLEEWQTQIAKYATGNSRLTFALSMAFAAPLLHLLGEENGGIHFHGSSSIGKSTILQAAGSVWGGNDHNSSGYIRQWRTTDNGLEGIAALHNDSLLCLDEISQAAPIIVGNAAYMLANGQGKARATKTGVLRQPSTWRLLFLSNGEVTLADKIREGIYGNKVMAGQSIRIIDIPADTESGHGIYETIHDFPSAATLSDHLKSATREYYGTAIHTFLHESIKEQQQDHKEWISGFISDFVSQYVPEDADGQIKRCAKRFGLIAAAGELAVQYKILPLGECEATTSAKICFDAWLENRGGTEALEIMNGIDQIRIFIERYNSSRFAIWSNNPNENNIEKINDMAGYRRKENNEWVYYFFPKVFTQEVCKGLNSTVICKAMKNKGILRTRNDDKLQYRVRFPNSDKIVSSYAITDKIYEGNNDCNNISFLSAKVDKNLETTRATKATQSSKQ